MKTTTYRTLFLTAACALLAFNLHAQFSFTNSNSLIPTATHSGCAVTVVDLNNDGLDDIVKMDQSTTLVIEMQNRNGSFTHYNLGVISNNRVWGMAVADVDHNGWKDIVTGPNGSVYLVKLSWNGSTIVKNTTTLPGSYFVQNITFGDFNNDGWADLMVCDDNAYAKVYVNNSGTLALSTTLINTNINPGLTYGGDPYDSGNYGSVWTDFDNDGDLDLYIAHCRQSTSSNTDQRRRDRLFVNDGTNHFTEDAQNYGIEVTDFKQSWTTSFGDIDNDGDLDIVMTNHGENGQVLQNDGAGFFTDVTKTSGFGTTFHGGTDPIESIVEDFDNDGYLDILISGGGPGDSYIMYHNKGNGTFSLVMSPVTAAPFPSTTNGMLSFATGDLNHDGKVDVFASYGNVYNSPTTTNDVLYLNSTKNTNHFITFNLTGTASNPDAIGARVTIYGPWGTQIREVRAGESYGTANSMQLHFGLGQATSVDSAIIDWPSHAHTRLIGLAADQFVTSVEGTCTLTGNTVPGPYEFCTGQTLSLNAASGYSTYDWSNGASTQSISVTASGNYNVLVTDGSGCSNVSPTVKAVMNPDETPVVTAAGPLTFCNGGSVTLNSSPSSSYVWSSGQTTQSITASTAGPYTVTTQGLCATFTSAAATVVTVTPALPVVHDDTSYGAASLILLATGNSISWYDLPTGGTLLATGNSYTTPVLSNNTTYWVENSVVNGGINGHVGQASHTGSSLYANTTNGDLQFDVFKPCTLNSVTVYSDVAANRLILLNDIAGRMVDSATVFIPVGTAVVTLNFALSPGIGYSLTTDATVNMANVGTVGPHLQRSSSGVAYPYTLGSYISLTSSNQGGSYYYHFYNWSVTAAPISVCTSARVPINAIILAPVGISNFTADNNFHIYPNPASQNVTVSFTLQGATSTKVEFVDATGRVVTSEILESNTGNYNRVFDVGNFAKGMYTVHVTSKDKTSYQQLIIQ